MRSDGLRKGLVVLIVTGMVLLLQGFNPIAVDGAEQLKASSPKNAATFIIAASNSSPQCKARADYVCDGIDDHVEIQKAIDALSDTKKAADGTYWKSISGGTVELSAGTFYLGAKLNFYDKVVNLIGTGKYSTALMLQKGVNDDMILVGTGTRLEVAAGRIAHLTLNGAFASQSKGSGIRVQTSHGLVIEDVRVLDFREHGIHMEAATQANRPLYTTIINCRVEKNKKNGIYLGPGAEATAITSCFINDNGTNNQPYHGIYIKTSQELGASCFHTITGCLLWQNRSTQISLDNARHIMITGCAILSSPDENIKIYGGSHVISVLGNNFHSPNEFGKGAPHITLGESPTSTASHIVISGNVFATPTRGLPSAQMVEAKVDVKAEEPGSEYVTMPQPPAILIEKPGSDYNKFIGNVIHGAVTDIILVGAHSSTDTGGQGEKE